MRFSFPVFGTLPDCEPDVAFAEVYTGETYDRLVESVSQSRTDGLVYEAPENPDYARTEILDLEVSDDLNEAVVSICTLAGDTELLISPDGSRNRVGMNNTILVEWGDAEMVLGDDGVWRITNYSDGVGGAAQVPFDEIDEQLEEGLLCGGRHFRRLTKASVLAISIVVSTAAAAEAQSTDETATINTR